MATATKEKAPAKVAPAKALPKGTPTVNILSALDASLSKVRELNPDVPTALAVIIASGAGKKHGHFAPGSWKDTDGDTAGSARHEILMSSESLARGAELTLVTLIHEAAHAANHAKGTKDTSRQGRYHNRDFRDTAEAFGLTTETDSKIGFVTTGLQSWAAEAYKVELALLADALVTHHVLAPKVKGKKTTIKVGCECETERGMLTVTVPIKWFDQVDMHCAYCDSNLIPV